MRLIGTRFVGFVVATCCCTTAVAKPHEGTSDLEADRSAIEAAYSAWAVAADAKDMSRWVSFLAPDALFLPPNHAALRNEQSIRDFYAALFADPLFSIKCKQQQVEVAASGDLAWSTGTCKVTFTGPDGQSATDSSKWVKVWKKQPDGQWKCSVNGWSSVHRQSQ